jgi:RimJ/RimL family protein N-acetyltransferase
MPPDTARLTFREMNTGDLDEMAALLGDPDVMTYYPRPKTRQEAAQWIDWNRRLYRTRGYGLWVILDGGGFAGDCGLTPQVVDGPRSASRRRSACARRSAPWCMAAGRRSSMRERCR